MFVSEAGDCDLVQLPMSPLLIAESPQRVKEEIEAVHSFATGRKIRVLGGDTQEGSADDGTADPGAGGGQVFEPLEVHYPKFVCDCSGRLHSRRIPQEPMRLPVGIHRLSAPPHGVLRGHRRK